MVSHLCTCPHTEMGFRINVNAVVEVVSFLVLVSNWVWLCRYSASSGCVDGSHSFSVARVCRSSAVMNRELKFESNVLR